MGRRSVVAWWHSSVQDAFPASSGDRRTAVAVVWHGSGQCWLGCIGRQARRVRPGGPVGGARRPQGPGGASAWGRSRRTGAAPAPVKHHRSSPSARPVSLRQVGYAFACAHAWSTKLSGHRRPLWWPRHRLTGPLGLGVMAFFPEVRRATCSTCASVQQAGASLRRPARRRSRAVATRSPQRRNHGSHR